LVLLKNTVSQKAGESLHQEIQAWDVVSKRKRRSVEDTRLDPGFVNNIVVSADGHWMAAVNRDRTVSVYDLDTQDSARILGSPSSAAQAQSLSSIIFSADGKLLARAMIGLESEVAVWEVPSGKELVHLPASAVNFSADGRTLVLGRPEG